MSICPDLLPIVWRARKRRNGFTFVELLVAITILSLMMIFIAQLIFVVGTFSRDGARRADNFTKVRATLDAFSRDVRAGIFRSDLAAFTDANGDTVPAPICFYTCRPGIGTEIRNVSLIVYQLNTATGSLQRGAMPVQWSDNSNTPPPISFNNTTTLPMFANVVPSDVASGVVRMEVYFINSGGALSKSYSSQSLAVGITLAVVDGGTLKVLSAAQLSQLTRGGSSGALPDDPSPSPTQTLGSFWATEMEAPGFYNGFPQQLHSGLRVFERYVELPTN